MQERLKSWITTLLGIGLLVGSTIAWFTEWFTDYEALGGIIGGFVLLYMKDTLILNIGKLFSVLINAAGNKLGSKPDDKVGVSIIILMLSSIVLLGQVSDATLTVQSDVIRNETVPGANTKVRNANMTQALIDSKVSILAPRLLQTSINGYVWTALGSTGLGNWQPGGTVSTVSASVPNGLTVNVTNPSSTPAIAITNSTIQTITSGTATTVSSGVRVVLINPVSLLGLHTITMPASPGDQDEVRLYYGGTISAGNTVVTTLTVSPNSGQSILNFFTPLTAKSSDVMTWKYLSSTSTWIRQH